MGIKFFEYFRIEILSPKITMQTPAIMNKASALKAKGKP